MSSGISIPDELTLPLETFSRHSPLLIALDFDGTLAPHVDRPEDARSLPQSASAIRNLTGYNRVNVALVSGRAVAVLRELAQPPERVLLAGSHGAEIWFGDAGAQLPLDPEQAAVLEALDRELGDIAALSEGVWVERKPAGRVLHTRLASGADAKVATARALDLAQARFPGVKITVGKNVVEFAVVQADKGDAITAFREHTEAEAVIYIGDDTTDEDAFRVLSSPDLGIKVGEGDTLAQLRVPDPHAVADVLGHLDTLLRDRR